MGNLWLELFGYLGSTLVVVSMLMASVVKLRVINVIGSIISGIYALIIGSFPLALMNFCLIVINVYNLNKLLKTKKQFEIVKSNGSDPLVKYFLNYNYRDVVTYFPSFADYNMTEDVAFVVFCKGNPAGILLGKELRSDTVDVMLDYSVPAYRDCSVGAYLYSNLNTYGIKKLILTHKQSDAHIHYLNKMGFEKKGGIFFKIIG